jgi:hypothetical protein
MNLKKLTNSNILAALKKVVQSALGGAKIAKKRSESSLSNSKLKGGLK